jgi:hypothetical protein
MSLESALRTQLLSNSSITAITGYRIFVGDTPAKFVYPFIRLTDAGENPDNYMLKNRLTKTVSIDIFAEHNPTDSKYGFTTLSNLSDLIRTQFDGFELARWSDTDHDYDVQQAEYRGYSTRKNAEFNDVQKPITLTIIYNIVS